MKTTSSFFTSKLSFLSSGQSCIFNFMTNLTKSQRLSVAFLPFLWSLSGSTLCSAQVFILITSHSWPNNSIFDLRVSIVFTLALETDFWLEHEGPRGAPDWIWCIIIYDILWIMNIIYLFQILSQYQIQSFLFSSLGKSDGTTPFPLQTNVEKFRIGCNILDPANVLSSHWASLQMTLQS